MSANRFTLTAAWQAAAGGILESWVQDFLRGPGNNPAFADGLERQQRWWIGPAPAPVEQLTRVVGPEPGMPYGVQSPAQWEARLESLAAHAATVGADIPPAMAFGDDPALPVSDGNHRYEVLRRARNPSIAVLLWFSDEALWRGFSRPWAREAFRTAGKPPTGQTGSAATPAALDRRLVQQDRGGAGRVERGR